MEARMKRVYSLVAVAVATTLALFLGLAAESLAAPADVPAGSKLEFSFNLIGYPAGKAYTGNCGDGHRIFVNREANHALVLVHDAGDWFIAECNATADNRAELDVDASAVASGTVAVYARILGKTGGHLKICFGTVTDFTSGEDLCLIGLFELTRGNGQSKFTLAPAAMFDASLEDLIWSVDTNADYRIVQFHVYSVPE
jgi:hypothetical protein